MIALYLVTVSLAMFFLMVIFLVPSAATVTFTGTKFGFLVLLFVNSIGILVITVLVIMGLRKLYEKLFGEQ